MILIKRTVVMIVTVSIMFSWLAAGCSNNKPVIEPVYDEEKTIHIGAWVAPPPGFINNETYKEIKESGINVIYGLYEGADANGLAALDAAQANGIKYLMYDRRLGMLPQEEISYFLPKYLKDYKDHPAFAGNLLVDEPGAGRYDYLAELVKEYKKVVPDKLAYINLFPTYSSLTQRDDLEYKDYVGTFLDKVQPEFLSYDHYPILMVSDGTTDITEDYYLNHEIVMNKSKEKGIPFWVFIQSISFGVSNREPMESDIRWQVYNSLAFGAKAIQHFTYWTPKAGANESFGEAMITADGKKTHIYHDVQKVNNEILAIDHILLAMESKGVMVYPKDNPPMYSYMENPLKSFQPIKKVEGEDPIAIGCLEDKDGNQALVVVNLTDPGKNKSVKCIISLNDIKECNVWTKGIKERVDIRKNKKIEISLDSGEGKLIQLLK